MFQASWIFWELLKLSETFLYFLIRTWQSLGFWFFLKPSETFLKLLIVRFLPLQSSSTIICPKDGFRMRICLLSIVWNAKTVFLINSIGHSRSTRTDSGTSSTTYLSMLVAKLSLIIVHGLKFWKLEHLCVGDLKFHKRSVQSHF